MGASSGGGGGRTMMAEINITPFVDVMLVLLIIFMVATPLIEKNDREKRKVELDLPVTRKNDDTIDPAKTEKMILEIDADLVVTIGEVVIVDCSKHKVGTDRARFEPCFETIGEKLGKNPKLQEEKELFIKAHTEIPYGFVVGTMARVKAAGVTKLGMITNPDYEAPEAGPAPGKKK